MTRARRGVDHELAAGSRAHYEDPAYYAHAYRDRTQDVAFYRRLAREQPGPVLEYGCGSGRITLPIARDGASITGVDGSKPMLGALRAQLRLEPALRDRVALRQGDMRSVRLAATFPLVICTFNTFLHLYERRDVERFLKRVRGHLRRSGLFVFDTSTPSLDDLRRDPSRAFRAPALRHPTLGVPVRYSERFDYDPLRQVQFVAMEFEPTRGAHPPFMTPLAHRQFFPAELEALLHYNGFAVERRAGGFDGEPADRHSDTLVWFCRARASRATL